MSVDLEAQFDRIDRSIEDASAELTDVVKRTVMLYEEAGALAGMEAPEKWAMYSVHSLLSAFVGAMAEDVQDGLLGTLGNVVNRMEESND